ncbi:DUF992 domain-containing protein [Ahrensia sp. R2A130]|uniref:DUF992 domain-containing protein n=1 Tax=Ahrensia sp. R2A130 TaxID=744979 RepID=UPI0001E0B4D9|nr:DUF992 domain-containing protein [Ahrensia sp. R2A130]EFL88723.1 conserved hypothetical protein [Ahrensia sp. R2A130]
MKNFRKTASLAIAAAMSTAMLASVVPAQAEVTGTRLGVLTCDVEGGLGLLIGSSKEAICAFELNDGGVEEYTGTLGKLGLDIGVSGESVIQWIVYTPQGQETGQYALAGTYVGVSAGGAIGIGLGANALVGGSTKKIGLQPFSIEGKTGINISAGLARLSLEAAK